MNKSGFEFILFDMIGTTVKDNGSAGPCIPDCFVNSFHRYGYPVGREVIIPHRGKSKLQTIKELLPGSVADTDLPAKIYTAFIDLLYDSLGCFSEMPGTSELFRFLKENQIKIGLGSGLPGTFMFDLIRHMDWDVSQFDYLGSSEVLGKGRPDPAMILDSMKKLNIRDSSKVLKIGDTMADILEGKNAGVKTAAVLTGTQNFQDLILQNPDFILPDISVVYNIL